MLEGTKVTSIEATKGVAGNSVNINWTARHVGTAKTTFAVMRRLIGAAPVGHGAPPGAARRWQCRAPSRRHADGGRSTIDGLTIKSKIWFVKQNFINLQQFINCDFTNS